MYKLPVLAMLSMMGVACTSTSSQLASSSYTNPQNFTCPSSHFALCEGHTPNQMTCECVDKQYQRSIMSNLLGN